MREQTQAQTPPFYWREECNDTTMRKRRRRIAVMVVTGAMRNTSAGAVSFPQSELVKRDDGN